MTRNTNHGVLWQRADGSTYEAWGYSAAGAQATVITCNTPGWSPRPVRVIHRDTETREANE